MGTLATVLRYEMFFLLAALAAIVGYRLLTRQINTAGLLDDKVGRGTSSGDEANATTISPGRVQMLVATLLVALYIVTKVAKTRTLPDIPTEYLLALGGSHALYLAGKIYGLFAEKLELNARKMLERSKQ